MDYPTFIGKLLSYTGKDNEKVTEYILKDPDGVIHDQYNEAVIDREMGLNSFMPTLVVLSNWLKKNAA